MSNSLRAPRPPALRSTRARLRPSRPGCSDWRDAVIYSVFVDRFFDGDATNNCSVANVQAAANYAGGDWKGVTVKIRANHFHDPASTRCSSPTWSRTSTARARAATGGSTRKYHGYWPSDVTRAERCFLAPRPT